MLTNVKWSNSLLENTGFHFSTNSHVMVLSMISIKVLVVAAHLMRKAPSGEEAAAGRTALLANERTRLAR